MAKWGIVAAGSETNPCCCEPEPEPDCCMYSAQGLADGDFTWEDLPESITRKIWYPIEASFTMNRVTPFSAFGYGTVYYEDAEKYMMRYDESPELWNIANKNDGGGSGGSPCLISGDGNFVPGDDLVEDQFSATYTFELYYFSDLVSTWTVTRESLCTWSYVESGSGDPTYWQQANLYYVPNSQVWMVDYFHIPVGNYAYGDQSGNQSTPVGTYPNNDPTDPDMGAYNFKIS